MDSLSIIYRSPGAVVVLVIAGMLAACGDDDAKPDAAARDASDGRADAATDAEASPRDADAPDAARDATTAEPDAGESEKCDRLDAPFDRDGASGLVSVRFVSIDPALEYKGYYDWTIELRDRSGKGIGDAELEAEAEMPAHGHGTTPIVLRHDPGSPKYELREVNLFMAGKWEVILDVRTSAGKDRVLFRACPRDPPDAGADEDGGAPRRRH